MIEHLATPVRQTWLRRPAALLRPHGHLLPTVDLAATSAPAGGPS